MLDSLLPLCAALIAFAFATMLLRRRSGAKVLWAIGFALFGVAAACEAVAQRPGWTAAGAAEPVDGRRRDRGRPLDRPLARGLVLARLRGPVARNRADVQRLRVRREAAGLAAKTACCRRARPCNASVRADRSDIAE